MKVNRNLTVLTTIALLLLFSVQCSRPPSDAGSLEIGQAAPPFTLPDLNGRSVSLDQYEGKIVIVDFWATWCAPCRLTMPLLEALQEEYSGKLVMLSVNLRESKGIVREYVLREGLGSKVLLDEDGAIGSRYGVAGIPMSVLIDQSGTVRYFLEGGDPRIGSWFRTEIDKLL